MAPALNLESLLRLLPPHAVHQTNHSQVFKIRTRRMFLHDKELEGRKVQLMQKLMEQLPYVLVWLKRSQDEVPQGLGNALWTFGEAGFWILSSETPLNRLLDELHEGGWGMFFFLRPPEVHSNVPEFLPTEPAEILSMLRATYAQAVILSWYDDAEWFYAFEVEQRAPESFHVAHE